MRRKPGQRRVKRPCGVVWCGVVWCGVVWCATVFDVLASFQGVAAGNATARICGESKSISARRWQLFRWAPCQSKGNEVQAAPTPYTPPRILPSISNSGGSCVSAPRACSPHFARARTCSVNAHARAHTYTARCACQCASEVAVPRFEASHSHFHHTHVWPRGRVGGAA